MAEALLELGEQVGWRKACDGLGMSRATLYRRPKTTTTPAAPRPLPAWTLSEEERLPFLRIAHDNPDLTPTEIYYKLLDDGRYICSPRRAEPASSQPRSGCRRPAGRRGSTTRHARGHAAS
jgi:hypothetical protein